MDNQDLICNYGLSCRQAEVAMLVSTGITNKAVATQLFITEKTVKFHLTDTFRKMGVKSRSSLIVKIMGTPSTITKPTIAKEYATPAKTATGPTLPTGRI